MTARPAPPEPPPAPPSTTGRPGAKARPATPKPDHAAPVGAVTPLSAVLLFTFLNSIGGGVVTTGFAFLAKSAYGFTRTQNYALGALQGVMYILGALAVGPILARAFRRYPGLTGRRVLLGLMILIGAGCVLPLLARPTAVGGIGGAAPSGSWAIWVLIAVYSLLTGVLWPMVESFMSGGRSAQGLRRAIGTFNVVWSSAMVVAFLVMAPLVEGRPLETIAGVGALHLLTTLLLPWFAARPGHHAEHVAEPHPAVYRSLLSVFRVELPASYLVYAALQPYLPDALASMGVRPAWQTPIAGVWFLSRVLAFVLFQQWHGWKGRWSVPIVGAVFLLAGFAAAVLAPRLPSAGAGLPTMIAGLAAFGFGMGIIYAGALYYVLEVGQAQVDAGGSHEALIGVGYTAGPLCGLAAAGAASAGAVSPDHFEVTMLGLVAVLAVGASLHAVAKAWRERSAP